MPAPRKYPNELRERAMRLVAEAREQDPDLSLNAAMKGVGPRAGINCDTLRGWCKQADIDADRARGTTTTDAARRGADQGARARGSRAQARQRDPAGGLLVLRELDSRLPW